MALDIFGLQSQCIEHAARCLLEYGRAIGPFMPWHGSANPYHWLVAEVLLRRTTRSAAQRAFDDLVRAFPTWEALAQASRDEILERIAWLGLGNQRSRHLRAMALTVTEKFETRDLCNEQALLDLPGVGRYIADAVRLHVCQEKILPIDASLQRVVRRVMGLPTPTRTAHSDPYRDRWVEKATNWVIRTHSADELATIHRSILYVAWENCRPDNPRCSSCPLMDFCEYALKRQ
jgi:A/G-specific adenine glycosylase